MLTRRHFLKTVIGTTTVAALTEPLQLAQAKNQTLLKPARLKQGSVVGIVSPAGVTFIREQLDIVTDAVKALGLVPKLAPNLLNKYGYLAGSDKQRAADINQFFADPDVAAILPIRGGWGCARILPYLDYNTIKKNPKIIVGFSDITALLLAINARTQMVTFHGPNGLTSWRPVQTDSFRRVLFNGEKVVFENTKDGDDANRLMQVKNRINIINGGRVKGKLIGGNLSVISAMLGSPYLPDFEGKILFLEEVGEQIYRVDRMMTHLKIAGVLDKLAGFVFGQCVRCNPGEDYGSLTMEEVIADHIKPLNIPSWSGAMIGHIEPVVTLPIGLDVEINADTGKIQLLDSAVA